MIMADVFKILFPIIGTLMSFVCYCLLYEGIAPAVVERCRHTYQSRPIRSLLLGIALGVPGVAIGLAFLNSGNPVGQLLGFTTVFLLLSLAVLGATGLASLIGHRLNSPQDVHQPWKRVYRGGIVLSITFLFPLMGWFMVLPFTMLSGLGAALMSLKAPKQQYVAPPMTATTPAQS